MEQKPTPASHPDAIDTLLNKVDPANKRTAVGKELGFTSAVLAFIAYIGEVTVLNLDSVKGMLPLAKNVVMPGSGSIDDVFGVLEVILMSGPFVLALTVILMSLRHKSRIQQGIFPGEYFLGFGLLSVAAVIGNALGYQPVAIRILGGTPQGMFASALQAYFNGYGFVLFFSSIVVGWFLAKTMEILSSE